MAGHSKWHNIKHRKAAVDSKRSRVWSKCAKAIMVAAKNGGSDPSANLTLRYAVDEARYCNMPRDTIERAIKKGAGELGVQNFENVRYEGYGPGGVAVVVEALTDNRTRTAGDVRNAFTKYGGNLGSTGCVSFMFQTRGQVHIPVTPALDADRLMEVAIEAGAADVSAPDEPGEEGAAWQIATEPVDFLRVKDCIEKAGFNIDDASITMIPSTTVRVTGDDAKKLIKLIDLIEESDDVQKVHANFEIDDDELSELD